MKTVSINLDTPGMLKILAKRYSSQYEPIPNSEMPRDLLDSLAPFYHYLTGKNLQHDGNTILVKASERGIATQIYGPKVYKGENTLIVKWGQEEIPLRVKPKSILSEVYENDFGEAEFSISSTGKTLVLAITMEDTNTMGSPVTCLELPLGLVEFDTSLQTLKHAQKDLSALMDLFVEAPSKNGRAVSIASLGEGKFKVMGYRKVTTSFGESFILTLESGPRVWANQPINPILRCSPEISPTHPAYLHVFSVETVKYKGKDQIVADCGLTLDPSLDLDGDQGIPF